MIDLKKSLNSILNFLAFENKFISYFLDKYTTNLELVVSAVEAFVYNKLKQISCYNNFLINPNELADIAITNEESINIFDSVERFFAEILPAIVESLNIEDEEIANETDNIDNYIEVGEEG